MKPFLIGKKIGMTQVFNTAGSVIPVTVIEAGPCIVTQVKTDNKDGYIAVQIGYGQSKKLTRSIAGHLKSADATSRHMREIRLEDSKHPKVGSKLDVSSFSEVKTLEVTGTSKGKGFSGVIKRHNFHRGPMSHGSDHHREPGSIGGMFPQRVLKGQRLPGHMGSERVTVRGLELISIDKSNNLLIVRGAVPGSSGQLLEITGVM